MQVILQCGCVNQSINCDPDSHNAVWLAKLISLHKLMEQVKNGESQN